MTQDELGKEVGPDIADKMSRWLYARQPVEALGNDGVFIYVTMDCWDHVAERFTHFEVERPYNS